MNAFLKLLIVALLFVVAMYVVDMIMPNQEAWLRWAVAGLIAGAVDIWVLDRNRQTTGYKIAFS